MKLIETLEDIRHPFPSAVVTIGNFDGVHIGHLSLFRKTIEKARSIGGTSVAVTFHPHPARALGYADAPPLLTRHDQKMELMSQSGLDVLIAIPFTKAFAEMDAESFVAELLVKTIGMKAIVVGEDYAYGKKRLGNLSTLREASARFDFEVILVQDIGAGSAQGSRVSSTRIRDLISEGAVAEARALLGRWYQIQGEVVRGRDRGGKLLGFPTANIDFPDLLCPRSGVYAVTVECLGATHRGVANIGFSPTFGGQMHTLEVHLIDFDQNLYGETLRVNFVARLRNEIKFPDLPSLINQIARDIARARTILNP